VDNGSSHRGQASVDRLQGAWPNLRLVHLPVHASWLNQIEIYFSVVQPKVLTPTTSWISPRSSSGCWASSVATSRPPSRSTGGSPEPTWTSCSDGWTTTSNSLPRHEARTNFYNGPLSQQAEAIRAAEEFLRALQPCRSVLVNYLGIVRQRRGDQELDQAEIGLLMDQLELHDEYSEKHTDLESTVPALEIYGTPDMARLGREMVALARSSPRMLSSFDRLDRLVKGLDALEESLQQEIHKGRHV
jgi:hypothetical protein